ncbi:hypothetical protein LZ30DRAFT_690161 [Colletotrichum cereale]|nr:hypothetical protein LZ30DRAFT_690161 [Colletotrichum cereale]
MRGILVTVLALVAASVAQAPAEPRRFNDRARQCLALFVRITGFKKGKPKHDTEVDCCTCCHGLEAHTDPERNSTVAAKEGWKYRRNAEFPWILKEVRDKEENWRVTWVLEVKDQQAMDWGTTRVPKADVRFRWLLGTLRKWRESWIYGKMWVGGLGLGRLLSPLGAFASCEFPTTEERAEFIAVKLSKIFPDDALFPKILEQTRVDLKRRSNLRIDRQPFPWQSVPRSKPKTSSDRVAFFRSSKTTRAALASPTSRERLDNGPSLMEEEPQLRRTIPGMTSIELRQTTWDDVFPGNPCAKNRPFEVAMPENVDYQAFVYADNSKWLRQLPPDIRMVTVDAGPPEGTTVRCLVIGYQEGIVDSPWDRILLTAAYGAAFKWAREALMTQHIVPLSHAFKELRFSLVHGNVGPSKLMMQLSLNESLVAECNDKLDLGPYRNQGEHAVFRVTAWLEKEKLLPAEECCRMLRGWCDQVHVKLESLIPVDKRMACQRAWEGKIKEWSGAHPPLQLSWDEEKKFAAEIAKHSL